MVWCWDAESHVDVPVIYTNVLNRASRVKITCIWWALLLSWLLPREWEILRWRHYPLLLLSFTLIWSKVRFFCCLQGVPLNQDQVWFFFYSTYKLWHLIIVWVCSLPGTLCCWLDLLLEVTRKRRYKFGFEYFGFFFLRILSENAVVKIAVAWHDERRFSPIVYSGTTSVLTARILLISWLSCQKILLRFSRFRVAARLISSKRKKCVWEYLWSSLPWFSSMHTMIWLLFLLLKLLQHFYTALFR